MAGIREWINEGMGKYIVIAIVVVLVGGAGWMVYSRMGRGSRADRVMAKGRPVLVICEKCGESSTITVGWLDPFPVVCPKCTEKQAYEATKCGRCNTIFKTPKHAVFPCPKCGAQFVTEQGLGDM